MANHNHMKAAEPNWLDQADTQMSDARWISRIAKLANAANGLLVLSANAAIARIAALAPTMNVIVKRANIGVKTTTQAPKIRPLTRMKTQPIKRDR